MDFLCSGSLLGAFCFAPFLILAFSLVNLRLWNPHDRSIDGIELRYNGNRWMREIIGGPNSGEAFTLLWAAKWRAEQVAA